VIRIGLTSYNEKARYGEKDENAAVVGLSYLKMVENAGYRAVILPTPRDNVSQVAKSDINCLDGLVLIGGSDIEPRFYGEVRSPLCGVSREDRDLYEIELVKAAYECNIPVLGICRGLQVMNVALGGTLKQDIGNSHKRQYPDFTDTEIEILESTPLSDIFSAKTIKVGCRHHQAVEQLSEFLRIAAESRDLIIEAAYAPNRDFFVGVQWHPESRDDLSLMRALGEAAERYLKQRL
jgi:putative glutamine amidotransferase